MPKLTLGKKCPSCGSFARMRIKRRWWMRFIPRSMYFRCDECQLFYLSLR